MAFSLDALGQLCEMAQRKVMSDAIIALALPPISSSSQLTSRFFGCSIEGDQSVRIMSLLQDDAMQVLSLQALGSFVSSLIFCEYSDSTACPSVDAQALFLHIGMSNGLTVRFTIDRLSASLSDPRTRYGAIKSYSAPYIYVLYFSRLCVIL